MRRALLVVPFAVVLAAGGCTLPRHDEGDDPPPSPSATPTPSPKPAVALPDILPTAAGSVGPADVVWAQGTVLHVGTRTVDVAPLRIDSFVVVRGGIYFLNQRELWLTDLEQVTPTRVTGVTALARGADATSLKVVVAATGGATVTRAWDTGTGRVVPAAEVRPPTVVQRLGRPTRVRLRSERSDVPPAPATDARVGPGGRFGVLDRQAGPLVAYRVSSRQRIPVRGVEGDGFELERWSGPARFEGLSLQGGRPLAVLGCDLAAGRCRSYGSVPRGASLLFESTG